MYKLLCTLARQQAPLKDINALTIENIARFMEGEYDLKCFTVQERFKFWSDVQHKPGEMVEELTARICKDSATCDFASIRDPQDEAIYAHPVHLLSR